MKRSLFFLISAVVATAIGCMMILAPARAAEGFGMVDSASLHLAFRALGVMIIGAGVLNFMVRQHSDSPTLRAVLVFNIVIHFLSMAIDVPSLLNGTLEFQNIVGSSIVHLFIGIGSLIYLMRMRRNATAAPIGG